MSLRDGIEVIGVIAQIIMMIVAAGYWAGSVKKRNGNYAGYERRAEPRDERGRTIHERVTALEQDCSRLHAAHEGHRRWLKELSGQV